MNIDDMNDKVYVFPKTDKFGFIEKNGKYIVTYTEGEGVITRKFLVKEYDILRNTEDELVILKVRDYE